MYCIRDCSLSDFADIIEIDKEAFNSSNPTFDLFVYVTYGSDIIVADIGRKVIGYLVLMDSGKDAKIMSFAVKKEFRKKGVGSKLMDEAIKRCRERGKGRLLLEVRVSNTSAQEFYKKRGFKIISTIPSYYSDGEDAYLMCLDLWREQF